VEEITASNVPGEQVELKQGSGWTVT